MMDEKMMEQEVPPVSPQSSSRALVDQLVAESVEYIYGREFDNVTSLLRNSKDTSGTIAALTFKTVKGVLKKKKDQLDLDIEMDTAMGVATEVIDMQLEILEKVQPDAVMDPQKIREDSLTRAMVMYGEQFNDDETARSDAQVMLRRMMNEGVTDQAFNYVNKRAKDTGLNTNDIMRTGGEVLARQAPQQTPLAGGIRQGLMGEPTPPMNQEPQGEYNG